MVLGQLKRTADCINLSVRVADCNTTNGSAPHREQQSLSECRKSCPASIGSLSEVEIHSFPNKVAFDEMGYVGYQMVSANLDSTISDHACSLVTTTELPDQLSDICDDPVSNVMSLEQQDMARQFPAESTPCADANANLNSGSVEDEVSVHVTR